MHWLSVALALSLFVPVAVPLLRKRHACLWTVVWNFAVFIVMYVADLLFQPGLYSRMVYDLGFDTARVGDPSHWYRLMTAMYVHAGPLHILMNMLILTLMGVPFEDRVGTYRWMGIYLVSGVIGALVDAALTAAAGTRHIGIGASGAIFGVLGAFAFLYPRDEIPMFLGFIFLPRVPVVAAVLFMGILETIYLLGVNDNIGHVVHVGSLLGGVGLSAALPGLKKKPGERTGTEPDLAALRALAIDGESSALLEKVLKEDVPEVRQAWLEQLLEKARCPRCRRPLSHGKGALKCSCGFELQYMK